MKRLFIFGTIALLMCSCANSVDATQCVDVNDAGGFWWGYWNGTCSFWSLLYGAIFDSSVAVYDVNNSGRWYDLGFLFGTSSGITGLLKLILILFENN